MLHQPLKAVLVKEPRIDPRPKVLCLSRNYPNNVLTLLGLWVEGLVRHSAGFCGIKVVSPVPYCPPLPGLKNDYKRFRSIDRSRWTDGVEIFHPRFVVPPGHQLHGVESFTYYAAVVSLIEKLRRNFPFDLIHAHYSYPDGWVAAKLGKRFNVPVIITEQNPWKPWMDDYALVRRQAVWAARQCTFHIAISEVVRQEIEKFTGESQKLRVIPDGIDGSVFTLPRDLSKPRKKQILFVGVIRPVKGVDVLLKSLRLLVDRGRDERLVLVGDSFYPAYRREYERMQQLTRDLGLTDRVNFAGKKPINELVQYMQESAVLVLPSRKESLGMVLAEALACGTPVVATRCGGPEEIVTNRVGVLVRPDDPDALAAGIELVIDRPEAYDPVSLREHALEKFSWTKIANQYADLYREAITRSGRSLNLANATT